MLNEYIITIENLLEDGEIILSKFTSVRVNYVNVQGSIYDYCYLFTDDYGIDRYISEESIFAAEIINKEKDK